MASTQAKKRSAKQVATAYFDAVRERDLEAMIAQWHPGGVDYLNGIQPLRVPEDYREWFGSLFRAMPDFRMEVVDMVAYGAKAAVRWRATGTFNGEGKLEGLSPTGASVTIEGLDLLTIRDGLIAENHAYMNEAEMIRQLGVMPPRGSLGERLMLGAANLKTAALAALSRLRDRL
jgi:steroid delta-isomerase-like uncharacterized protein